MRKKIQEFLDQEVNTTLRRLLIEDFLIMALIIFVTQIVF